MTIVTTGSDEVIEQITKHLNRLIEVVKVVDLTEGSLHRARADAHQGARRGQGARGDEAHGRHLPRPHHRRHREELHHRAHRRRSPSSTPSWRPSTAPAILETVRTGASGIGRGERILRV
jgi:acetolactate synthase-1/3 small subunit